MFPSSIRFQGIFRLQVQGSGYKATDRKHNYYSEVMAHRNKVNAAVEVLKIENPETVYLANKNNDYIFRNDVFGEHFTSAVEILNSEREAKSNYQRALQRFDAECNQLDDDEKTKRQLELNELFQMCWDAPGKMLTAITALLETCPIHDIRVSGNAVEQNYPDQN